ncbi:baculoviral IAP repeat-containing protein 6 isoform X5 [Myripristis murdjan]|uniref:baculoviral IAP repeat-containing protein 6 isoform X5 n=1 Tax=Myripristis murdjan TaxID=586833 RepID=UPI0011761610|nr:baculoviral IAP repeat-containing protein 6 isoform X5 [Myripristis murdjan]
MAAAASPGSGSSTSSDWIVLRDGCLRCDEEGLRSLSYHPALNAILAVTSRGSIKVIDGTSGAILQASALHAKPGCRVRCQYFPAVDKVLFVDDYVVGCRKDLNGILLLDTALQPPVAKPEDMVQLELPVTEAQQMLSACQEKIDVSNTEGYDLFITQLKEGLKNTSHETAANHKVAKWATVTFHLPHHVLKLVASAIVNELKKINQNVAALSVASSIMDRLSYLLSSARPELGVGPGRSVDRSLMYSEANRRETFTSWPHAGYRWAQPDPMAQAGFYHQPASTGDDRAMCFTCSVCLVCWEPTDEPWSEHERHSPNCPFVKGEHTQNVPLSVTLATSPAQFPSSPDSSDKIACYGFGSCPHFLAAATKRGKICIWDVSKMMKVHLKFEINPYDPAILKQLILCGGEQNQQALTESRRPTLAWLEESSSCSDLPKLEGDSDDQLEDSDSDEHSRSESVTGQPSQRESMEVSLGVTALSVLQQPEKLQWEVVASVLEDTVKDLEELGANPSLAQAKAHGQDKAKDKVPDHHNIPFPCLLAGGLLSYRSAASSPLAGPPPTSAALGRRTMDSPCRTQGPEPFHTGPLQDQGPMEIETCNPTTAAQELGFSNLVGPLPPSPSSMLAVRRTIPVLLLYSIKEVDDKSSGKVFTQMNNLMSKGLHEEGFTVPQIIEMEFDTHEQLLLQDPPITYIQQFADAAANLAGLDGHVDKWSTLAAATVSSPPRPGALVQCLRLPKHLEEENLYVDSITPCWDGVHLLVGLQPCGVESLSAINQVEALNNLNRLHSALCSQRKGDPLHPIPNGVEAHHPGGSPPQTPLILPPGDQQQQQRSLGSGSGGGYLAIYKLNYSTRIVTLDEEPVKVQHIRDPRDAITSLILLPPDVLDGREDDSEEAPEDALPPGPKNGLSGFGTSSAGCAGSGTGTVCGAATTGTSTTVITPSTTTSSPKEAKRLEVSGLGHLVVTTQAGYIMILDLSTLEVLAKVEPPKREGSAEETDPFVSVTYCSGTDRLCACTKGGELHFLQIGGVCDDIDDGDMFVDGPLAKGTEQLLEGAKPCSNPSSPGITGVDLLVDQTLTTESLTSLVELTRFETLTPRFSATVPPCWVEVQQEQQQRRHPQHLHQQHHGDAAQHTRTWKLQSDSSSWDEHVFELVLPKACMVGHVDFKFVMNANITNIPQIQVTLLKNKAPGLGKVSETAVDRQISFPLSHVLHANGERNGQPLLQDFTEDIQFMDIEETSGSMLCPFLEDHKEDILCGPVWLASGLDLSGHAGMLSLTSPKLVKGMAGGKYRSFLVHIKAVSDKGMEESPRPVVRMPSAKPQGTKAHSLSTLLQRAQASKEKASTSKAEPPTPSKKLENLRGCDLLQEVSVTIRRFKKTSIPKERVQRCAMLQFPDFHEKLLNALCRRVEDGPTTEHAQSLILDILCWLAGVFSSGPCSLREGKEGLLAKTRKRLTDIVRVCFFEAGRSIAHKCARFLALCISNGKGDPSQQGFGMGLLKALLDNMPYLPAAATGGSVFWYFVLLNYVKEEDLAGCSTACASLLTAVSRQLQDRLTPLEALLQTRYGLYSSPFDPVLFDLEVSGSSCKNAFNSSIGVQSDEIDLSDILSGNGKVSSCAAAEGSFTALTGLLEVEPLHFTCISTSDGTRVERDDASMFTVSTFGVTPAVGGLSTGTVGEASTALSSAAQVALQSLSHAMVSAEQQLQVLQEKQQQLLKLQQQKAKLEAKLHQTTSAAAAAASGVGPIHNSVPSNPSSAPGFFIHPSDVIPPTPKTTPLFMTPPLTPPNEAVSAAFSAELAHLFPGSMMEPGPVNLVAHNKNSQKAKPSPMGSGLALAISQASHFLQPPPHQSIIIERMHSGARRFVTLDFGRPVLLTDALIPTCGDLASLSIDIWTLGEEVDGRRLVVATDISTHSLILHDLLPPPVCRFMKITVIGRYGSTNARAKIPLGFYYGHTYILPWESELKLMHDPLRGESEAASQPDVDQHLAMMVALQEDIQCRYNLACHRLETLLQNIDLPPLNSANNAQYFLRKPDKAVEEDQRVFSAYQDCIQLQLQLNLAHHAVQRLRVSLGAGRKALPDAGAPEARELIHNSSTEQLRTVIRYLLDTLLSLLHSNNGHSVPSVLQSTFHAQACEELFKHLCISGTPKIRLHAGLLLVQLCGGERWWGQFLSNVLQELYNSEQLLIFPQDRVFMLLSCIGQRSLSNSGVLEGLLNLLDSLLSPLQQPLVATQRRTEGVLDIPMISWVVMLVSRLLDYVASIEDEASGGKKHLGGKDRERTFTGNQWSFINNSLQSQNSSRSTKGNSSLDRLYSRKIRKQLVHHKQQLNLLKAKQKALVEQIEKEKIQSNKGSSYKLLVEQAKLKQATSKHFKDLIRLRRTAEWPRSTLDTEATTTKEAPEVEPLPFTLAHERCISVVQKLALFLLSMDFTCHADLLLFVCKVLARIANATRPTIHLCEIVSEQQLERLLLLLVGTDFNRGDISWGGAWAQYSLTCMLQDILAGELLSPVSLDVMDEVAAGEEAGASSSSAGADSDDSMPQPAPIPLVESIDEALAPDIIAGAPPLSSLEKDKDIDFDLLQDLMDVDIDPLDIDLEKDPLAAKVFKPISSTWYDYWGADYGTYGYNPYIGGVGIPVSKPPAAAEKPGSQGLSVSVSQALDARLEVGLEQQAELMLKMMATLQADSILQALTSTSPTVSSPPAFPVTQASNGTDDSLLRGLHGGGSPPGSTLMVQASSIPMLSACFNKLFSMLQVHHVQLGIWETVELESLLQLWLTLSLNSCSGGSEESGSDIFLFNASRVPTIPLNQASISSFLTVLAWYPNTSLRTWCLVLHSLTLMTNMPACASGSGMNSQESTAQQMVSDPTLVHVLVRFLSGSSTHGTSQHSSQVGPTATQAMQEFLTRLQVHLSSTCPQMFSEFLLKLMHILSTERGPFQSGQGPLDAQVKLLEFTLEQNFEVVSVSTISSVIESITFLVHHYITCSDKVVSRSGSDSSVGARACFGGLFANIIRPGDAKAVCGETTRDQLMFDLLKLVNVLVQLPLSGDREFSGRLPPAGSGTADSSVSDEEKVCGSKEGMMGGSMSSQGPAAGVADLVLANQQIMSQILSALGQCNSSAMAMIIGASGLHLTKHENFHGGLDAISVGDGLFTILTTLSKRATSVQVMLQPILTYMACGYMGRQGSLSTCQLSEPLLWFILRVLDTSEALKAFHDMGGVQLICNNMVTSTRAIVNTARSMVSTIMKFLDSGPGKAADGSLKARVMTSEPDNAEGLHNFAPLGTITSSSPTAQPAEVLLQATPPHRRARSAAWSYIFLPEEAWCDLTIHLPAAVLLKELHIQPHLASLATCPSSVSVEISADGVNMLPLSTPVITSGLTYIKIQLVKAEVASAVCLRLHRPRDASTLGLSQIKLLGLTAFGNTSSATVNNPFLPSEDQVSKTSIGWLRLLHHCLTHVSDLEAMMASAAAPTANLLQTCAALLMSPYCGMHSPNIEAVLVKIGLQSTRIGLKLIDILLRNCAASGTDPANLNSPLLFGRLNGLSSDSTIDILYQLGTTQDPGTKDRIQALLQWVHDSSRVAAHKRSNPVGYIGASAASSSSSSREYGLLMPSPSHLHCVAAILWHSYELPVDYDLPVLLNRELFELLYNWSMSLPCNMVLKKAVDSLLCSMCHIHPSYFSLLMSWMGIVSVPTVSHSQAQHHRLAMTDDGKKQHDANTTTAGLTDDSKHARPPINLSESQLTTLAAASQSPGAIEQLLDSGLPSLLVRSLAQLCCGLLASADLPLPAAQAERRQHHHHYHSSSSSSHSRPSLSAELAAPVLRFLTEVGNSHAMKDWLGGPEVNPLWTALLFLLCHSSASAGGNAGAHTGSHPAGPGATACPPQSQPQPSGSRYSLASSGRAGGLTTQQRTALENATVAFFLQCISCHPNNQRLMAQVLCELFQSAPQRGNVPISGNISGFIRRLFLQLMLEDEKVTVFLQSPCPLYKGRINATSHVIQHPMYGAGHKYRTLHLPISTTLAEVLDRVSDTPSITAKLINEQKEDKEKKNHEEKEKMKADSGFQDNYSVVVASGLKSQSKRALSTPPRPPSRRGRVMSDKLTASSSVDPSAKTISVPVFHLYHKLLPGQPLPAEMTLAQLLTLLYDRKLPQGYRSIDLTVKLGSKVISDPGLSKTDSFKRLRTEKEMSKGAVAEPWWGCCASYAVSEINFLAHLPRAGKQMDHCDMLSSCPEDEPMTPSEECLDAAIDESLLETSPIQSPLQVFAGMGGLALIAERLPMLYPDVIQQVSAPVVPSATQEKPKDSDQFEWVTIEQSGELVYEAPETIAAEPPPINKQQQSQSSSSSSVQTMSPIPAHSLAAFGLFLRLPGYAEVLLKERKHAQCLLRLVLGVTDDGEGSHILQSPSANVLPTLPFHVLRALFSSTPLTTDDGVLLRRMALEIGAIHLILACLSALSHHAPRVPNASTSASEPQVSSGHGGGTSEEQQLYWAKGTGFGTGSTASGWDVEQALTKQRLEEEHVTCLLQVLASYINPAGCTGSHSSEAPTADSRTQNSSALPAVLQELLSQSCLIPAMSSYLRNDSVLDMARHVPLYRALLELLRAISTCTALVPLLLPLSGDPGQDEEEEEEERSEGQTSVGMLLAKMKTCVDTYTNRLRSKKDKSKGVVKTDSSDPEPEGLTLLVPDIQRTAEIVYAATTSLRQANQERKLAETSKKVSSRPKPLSILRSLEEKYVAAMKKLQFDTFEMVSEEEDGKLVFKVNYHYMSQVKNASDANSAARARRLAQEAVTLSTSLPLSSSSSVFVRCDEERLDIMKVLITGPADTPYANGCFEFDVYFPQDYPNSPPLVNLETTGGHSVRFNPNLYNDGKVCLSILNTWHGRPEEKWNPQTSSFLQVLVSVQSLILVAEPYFNEPGYERSRGTPSGTQSSREYDGNIRQATVKWAMLEQMRNPSPCFKEVIHKHFYLKRAEIMSQCEEWIADIQQYSSDKRVGRTMSHHAAALKRHTAQLREELLKLPCPEGLEPDGDEFPEKSATLIVKELPNQDAEKPSSSQDSHSGEGQL